MARLLVSPGSPGAWEIHLKPGPNSLGRGLTNDFKIDDPSVSGSHCQVLVDHGHVLIKDLGSTNGTYVNRSPVKQAVLEPGQIVHLGGVEMLFQSDLARLQSVPEAPPAPPPPIPVSVMMPPVAPSEGIAVGSHNCKFHPKTSARYFCQKCNKYFCELCVTSRAQHRSCRQCGAECTPIQVKLQRAVEKGFFARLPGAFLYPFRGAGVFVVSVGIVVLAMIYFSQFMLRIGSIRAFIFGIILILCSGGYLFTYLQAIVHSTVAEDRELPDLPGISNFVEDVLFPFFRLLGLIIICFGPALGLGIWAVRSDEPSAGIGFLVAVIVGYLYFPMAFLAVAVLDSVFAANPLVVVNSIIRAPLQYLVALLFLASSLGFRVLGGIVLKAAFPEGWTTHSMGQLFLMIGGQVFVAFTTFYLLIIGVHSLGLVYVTKKVKLGWLEH